MRLFKYIIIGLLGTTNCSGQTKDDKEKIRKSVASFYGWYIGTTKDLRYSKYVKGIKAEDGMTKLETADYFARLDSLGVVGAMFIQSERDRFKPCADLLKTIPWTTYSTADDFPYEDKCGFLYYYYWTYGHEPHDGVEVADIEIKADSAIAITNIYYGNGKTAGAKVLVHLTKDGAKWVINKIERVM